MAICVPVSKSSLLFIFIQQKAHTSIGAEMNSNLLPVQRAFKRQLNKRSTQAKIATSCDNACMINILLT
ncbi:hypothetical protein HMPREF9372_1821 [Sporosarcina newyorkensis 2681]|uniref:Uncharacterized protein n=1 Tax=Sporosarcina newyorkensis 2681 TaxID=1027292 RepID=F9DSP0_9BACL|nr:hypothetical protein HMPREF9372_1821 [Sporosarcina newyorkensis 2681]